MNFSYAYERNMRGEAQVTTTEGLGIEGACYSLDLSTHKHSRGGLYSSVRVYKHEGNFKSTDLFGDFNKTLVTVPGRATEKALIACHEKALDYFAQALIDAKAHTVAKLAKEAEQEARNAAARADRMTNAEAAAAMQDVNCPAHPMHY